MKNNKLTFVFFSFREKSIIDFYLIIFRKMTLVF